jgi:hypothetical protein
MEVYYGTMLYFITNLNRVKNKLESCARRTAAS